MSCYPNNEVYITSVYYHKQCKQNTNIGIIMKETKLNNKDSQALGVKLAGIVFKNRSKQFKMLQVVLQACNEAK